jgi:DNA-binding NarL/FixJ family response regulator
MIKRLQSVKPEQLILVLSRHDEKLYAERIIRAGANGYVMKLEDSDVIVRAVRQVLEGRIFLSQEINDRLLQSIAEGRTSRLAESTVSVLSDRELQVYKLLGQGLGTRDIADRLDIAVKTVESYRGRIKKKLNLENATELVRHAVGWVQDNK